MNLDGTVMGTDDCTFPARYRRRSSAAGALKMRGSGLEPSLFLAARSEIMRNTLAKRRLDPPTGGRR